MFTHFQTSMEGHEVPHEKDGLCRAVSQPICYLGKSAAFELTRELCMATESYMDETQFLGAWGSVGIAGSRVKGSRASGF